MTQNDDIDGRASTMATDGKARTALASIASLGAIETAYLTYAKLTAATSLAFCSASGSEASSCSNVLTGPYAEVGGTSIPLAALGCIAYTAVVVLALAGRNGDGTKDSLVDNRAVLTLLTSSMALVSIGLISLLWGVLHENCLYCLVSATLSVSLGTINALWSSNSSFDRDQSSVVVTNSGIAVVAATVAALVWNGPDAGATSAHNSAFTTEATTTTLLAATTTVTPDVVSSNAPPAITTDSSPAAMSLARDLQSLDARFYGAFWCSHCYEQKQTMGRQAMEMVPYLECAPDGVNSQNKVCKAKKVPGYPTWEIAGVLYPGEQALDELREIVDAASTKAT